MFMGMIVCHIPQMVARRNRLPDHRLVHIGVGFCVARSTVTGNAKARMRGTGNRYGHPRFFVCYKSGFRPDRGALWPQTK